MKSIINAPLNPNMKFAPASSNEIHFSKARWIWDKSDAFGYNYYLEAKKSFTLSAAGLKSAQDTAQALLLITADALYQVWINGVPVGHGPAKSAEGRRSVDTYEIGRNLVRGENVIEVLVLSIGTGLMTYCLGQAGLIFELRLPDKTIASDPTTLVRKSNAHNQRTVRRWIMQCLEDVDAAAQPNDWQAATLVERNIEFYSRRVPLPTREPRVPQRMALAQNVSVPNFSVSFRLRPYLAEPKDRLRNNLFHRKAYVICDLISPADQTFRFTPSLGNLTWYYEGEKLFEGSGWHLWSEKKFDPVIQLRKGANRLVGLHQTNHFEDINLVGFAEHPLKIKNPFGRGAFQVIPVDDNDWIEGSPLKTMDWERLRPQMVPMSPSHTFLNGNAHALAVGASVMPDEGKLLERLKPCSPYNPIELPPTPSGEAVRVVYDLGVLHNGWVSFEAEGHAGSSLIFSFFESLDEGPAQRIQWPTCCNNAFTYRLRDGHQSFESFQPYGIRYIMVTHAGNHLVKLKNLRVVTANCGSWPQGSFICTDSIINGIYKISVQSLISGTDDTLTDCPTFEQVNWNCDNRWASLCDYYTCANTQVVANSIQLFAEDKGYPGLVRSQYPSAWDNQIPLWSFHWLMWCDDHYQHTGDLQFAKNIFPQVSAGIEDALSKINSKGLLEWPGAWHLVEWGHGRDDDHSIMGGEQAGLVGALIAAERLAEALQFDSLSGKWKQARKKLITAIHRHLWCPAKQAFADSLHENGAQSQVTSQVTNAMMALYGVGKPSWGNQLVRRIAASDPQLLAYGSPYGMYYLLELLDKIGDVKTLFAMMKHRYGDMILAGDTTTWETFSEYGSPDKEFPTRSRCHPCAAYVVKYLMKYILGVEIITPGFTEIRIRPNPPKELQSATGSIPTPHGLIRISWHKKGREIILKTDLPKGIKLLAEP